MSDEYLNFSKISAIYKKYSINDIATSLFIMSLWLPNISSQIKHILLTSIFTMLDQKCFSKKNKIKIYSDFKIFFNKLLNLVPSFPTLEDYVPELDWGNIKFHINGKNLKMFYGSEIENPYDYLSSFELFYSAYQDTICNIIKRDPINELEYNLQIQDDIINGINTQPDVNDIDKRITPGHIELPSQIFWENSVNLYTNLVVTQKYDKNFMNNFSIKFGSLSKEILMPENFVNMVFSGKLLNAFFINNGDTYYPILPRRYNTIFLEKWDQIYLERKEEIIEDFDDYIKKIGSRLFKYIESRWLCQELYPFVSAIKKNNKPDEIIYPSAFISGKKLFLLYIIKPIGQQEDLYKQINFILPKLKKSIRLISTSPITIGLHTEGKNAVFSAREDGVTLQPYIFLLIPKLSPSIEFYDIPKKIPGKIIFLDQFLGFVDEIEYVDTVSSFLDYLENIEGQMGFLINLLDQFGSFKLSHGVLIEGAISPNLILLDPHTGSNIRFETLQEFWSLYPEIDFSEFMGHPRNWRVKQETQSRIRLEARSKFETMISTQIGKTTILLSSPFSDLTRIQVEISNLLMECLEDTLQNRRSLIENHVFFKMFSILVILFYPYELISKNKNFQHLKLLDASKTIWCSDFGFLNPRTPGIRIVYNENIVFQTFKNVIDSSAEVDLLIEVFNKINNVVKHKNGNKIIENIIKTKSSRPRYKMFEIDRSISFPEFAHVHEPITTHYKLVRKRISEVAKRINIIPKFYEVDEAKLKLNELRKKIVNEIDLMVKRYNFTKVIPFLISQIDSLTNKYERNRQIISLSQEHQVDYNRQEKLAKEQTEYVRIHRNIRYLIEKFVQLVPDGNNFLEIFEFQYLIAMIDWLHILYQASDSIHYEIFTVGLNISEDYLLKVIYSKEMSDKQAIYAKEQAEINLGLIGDQNDRVESPRPIEDFLNELDQAFKQDLGFGFRNMVNVLQILSLWAQYNKDIKLNTYYSSDINSIIHVCKENILDIDEKCIEYVINYLTLKSYDVIRILGQDEPCDDLPIWEHRKRYSRYTLRPIISIGNKYFWGSYSTMKTGILWSDYLPQALLPFDLQSVNIEKCINHEKKLIENELENKSHEIVNRYAKFVKNNVELHKMDRSGKHPEELGEFDVISYLYNKNVILNIECKDISPVYCPKDAQRLRRTIFGEKNNSGYLLKLIRRQKYLEDNYEKILKIFKWPIKTNNPPKIVPMFVTRRSYWWTRFPPEKAEIEFLRIDMLAEYIEKL